MPNMNIEKIEWRDSFGVSSDWTVIGDIDDAMHITATSIGYVLKETDDYIIVVPHYVPDSDNPHMQAQGCGDMSIPKCSIVKRTRLEPVRIPPDMY